MLTPPALRNRLVAMGLMLGGFATVPTRHRGFSRLAEMLGKLATPGAMATVNLTPHSRFCFPLADAYWNRLLCPAYRYEPEIAHILRRLAGGPPCAFLDCGANLGYWSVLASDPAYGMASVTAVEMVPTTLQRLRANAALNGNRFQILPMALHAADGAHATLQNQHAHHSAASITLAEGGSIATISLKTLVEQTCPTPAHIPVIKLDVEGVEDTVISGYPELFNRPCVVVFEDHGRERNTPLANRLLADPRVRVLYVAPNGHTTRMQSVTQMDALKTNPHMGYNFIATTNALESRLSASTRR